MVQRTGVLRLKAVNRGGLGESFPTFQYKMSENLFFSFFFCFFTRKNSVRMRKKPRVVRIGQNTDYPAESFRPG